MNEEELFCKLFPEYVVNGKPLSPYIDLFESGCEQAENRIEELETRCNELFFQVNEKIAKIDELEETNNELKGKLVLNDMVLTDKTKRIKELEDKLTEKVTLESLDVVSARIKGLEKENAELKEAIKHFNPCGEWNDDIHDCEFRHYAMEYGSKLTKAKKLIKNLLSAYTSYADSFDDRDNEIVAEAEQFISEVVK